MFTRNSIVLSNNIKTPLTALSKAVGNILQLTYGQLVKQLFANNEQGFAYDPNDLTTLYQDAAGTIPVTAAGQPVGLMLDKSKGLSLSSNINSVTNIESVPIGGAAFNSYPIGGNSVAGKAYLFEFAVTDYSGTGNVTVSGGGSQWLVNPSALPSAPASNVTYKVILFALVSAPLLFFTRSTNQCKFSNISVKELAGNHAYQTVSTSRPILQQTPILGNELVANGSFDTATGWTTYLATLTYANSRALIISTGSGGAELSRPAVGLAGKTVEVRCKFFNRSGGARATLLLWDASKSKGASKSSTASTGEISFVYAVPADFSCAVICKLEDAVTGSSVEFDDVSIKEVTGYRTDQNYLEFDGVDDFLQTNNIDFTATDKVSLFTGIRKLTDANVGAIAEFSGNVNSNTGSFWLLTPLSVGANTVSFASRGSAATVASIAALSAPTSAVLRGVGDISGDNASTYVNGKLGDKRNTDQGTGNYGNHPLYIGRRGGTQLQFNGHLYSLISIGRLTTDSETIALEKSIAKNTGVTLNV